MDKYCEIIVRVRLLVLLNLLPHYTFIITPPYLKKIPYSFNVLISKYFFSFPKAQFRDGNLNTQTIVSIFGRILETIKGEILSVLIGRSER